MNIFGTYLMLLSFFRYFLIIFGKFWILMPKTLIKATYGIKDVTPTLANKKDLFHGRENTLLYALSFMPC